MRRRPFPSWSFVFLIVLFLAPSVLMGLHPLYLRNGEIYLLIGGGATPLPLRGVYRLSDPANDGVPLGRLYDPRTTIGISVDLNRNVYTLSYSVGTVPVFDPSRMLLRQVLDIPIVPGMSKFDHPDFGCHAFIHADHRRRFHPNDVGAVVYKTGPVGRRAVMGFDTAEWVTTLANPGSLPTGFYNSAGPGIPAAPPPPGTNPLPNVGGGASQNHVVPGRNWYLIPNGAWYATWYRGRPCSCWWRSGNQMNPRGGWAVYRDRVSEIAHNWRLCSWRDGMANYLEGNVVARSFDLFINRAILTVCLDGCGGNSGTGSGVALPRWNSVAFQAPVGGGVSRVYLYSREKKNASEYSLTLSIGGGTPANYSPPATNPIIGNPFDNGGTDEDRGARWVGVSLRDSASDYVYVLSSNVIEDWYEQWNGTRLTLDIEAIGVSNQWNQQGGIVYGYARNTGRVYKFVRNDRNNANAILDYEAFNIGLNVDDIKADGFGNLYFTMTTMDPAADDPRPSFESSEMAIIDVVRDSSESGMQRARAIYEQVVYKEVFERNTYDALIHSRGKQTIGSRFFGRVFEVPVASYPEVAAAPYIGMESRLLSAGGYWTIWTSAEPYSNTESPPERTEIAVINVPTPPMVIGATSSVDIVGPYLVGHYPVPNRSGRDTRQDLAYRPDAPHPPPVSNLPSIPRREPRLFMVENYPLIPTPQNPLNPVRDYNRNGFAGGFVSSIDTVTYTWRLYTVAVPAPEDPLQPGVEQLEYVPVSPDSVVVTQTQDPYFVFYSVTGGRYILTLEASYDWWDWTKMGPTEGYELRAKAWTTGTPGFAKNRADLLADIAQYADPGHPSGGPFSSIWASLTLDLGTILPDTGSNNLRAAIPIYVPPEIINPPDAQIMANIERCDNPSSAAGNQIWAVHHPHGCLKDKTYAWRIEGRPLRANPSDLVVGGLEYLFSPVDRLVNVNPNSPSLNDPSFNYLGYRLTSEGDALYVNSDPNLVFEFNEAARTISPLSLEWRGMVALNGYAVATMPDNSIIRVELFREVHASTLEEAYALATFTIPSDPGHYRMVIEAHRQFRYKVFPEFDIPVFDGNGVRIGSQRERGSPLWLGGVIKISGRGEVVVIDSGPPVLAQNRTSPRNLYGFTGQPLENGVNGNPSSIEFVFHDDNPWENGPFDGLSAADSARNRARNLTMLNNFSGNARNCNLLPIFSKRNRAFEIEFEGASFSQQVPYPSASDRIVRHVRTGIPMDSMFMNDGAILPSVASPASTLVFDIPIAYLSHGLIPPNYANNSSGYHPLRFFVTIVDSSGNSARGPLNLVLNVRDNIPPFAWGRMFDHKNSVASMFPAVRVAGGPNILENQYLSSMVFQVRDAVRPNNYRVAPWVLSSIPGTAVVSQVDPGYELRMLPPTPGGGILRNMQISNATYYNNLVNHINAGVPPGHLEDNVEFDMFAYSSDNAGTSTVIVEVDYLDHTDQPQKLTSDAQQTGWSNQPGSQAFLRGLFRGLSRDFPIGFPVEVRAFDNALDWNGYGENWVWSGGVWPNVNINARPPLTPANPASMPNSRVIRTVIPVFDSRLLIRVLDMDNRR